MRGLVVHRRGALAARARRGERGAVLMMVALSMTIVVTCTALTVDLGRVSTMRRELQNVADAAALDLARALDGTTPADALVEAEVWHEAVGATLDRNGFGGTATQQVEVAVGHYDADTDEFTPYAGAGVSPPFGDVPDAVRVRVHDRVDYAFAPGGNSTSRQAVATRSDPLAGIQIGSFAARLATTQSPLLAPLLGPLGGQAGLDVLSHQGLADVSVRLDALAAQLGLSAADPAGLLGTEIELVELIEAQAEILELSGLLTEATVLRSLMVELPNPSMPVTLGHVLSLATGAEAVAAAAQLNVVDLIVGSVLVANGDNAVRIPNLAVEVPGATALSADVKLIERPRWAFGPEGTEVETSQVELNLSGTFLPAVGGTFAPLLTLDLDVEVASGRARILDILCGPDADALDVDVLAELITIGGTIRGNLLGAATVEIAIGGERPGSWLPVDFSFPPDEFGVPRQVSKGLGPLLAPTLVADVDLNIGGWARNQLQSLLSGLSALGIDLDLLGLGGLLGGLLSILTPISQLRAAVQDVVNALVAELTSTVLPLILESLDALVDPLLDLLGITAPGADVTPLGLECGGRKLVV